MLTFTASSHICNLYVSTFIKSQTKKEVHFMYEEAILEMIYQAVSARLRTANESRTFYTQSVLKSFNSGRMTYDNEKCKTNDENEDETVENLKPRKRKEEFESTNDNIIDKGNVQEDNKKIKLLSDENIAIKDYNLNSDVSNTNIEEYREINKVAPLLDQDKVNHLHLKKEKGDIDRKEQKIFPSSSSSSSTSSSSSSGVAKAANKMVRTDPALTRIDAFYRPSNTFDPSKNNEEINGMNNNGNDKMNLDNDVSNEGDLELYCGICLTGKPTEKIKLKKNVKNPGISDTDIAPFNSNIDDDDDDDNDFTVKNIFATETISGCQCCDDDGNRYKKRKKINISPQENENHNGNSKNNELNSNIRLKMVKFDDTKCAYESVKKLILEIRNSRHEGIDNILKNNTFVGIVDSTYCSVQYGTKLLLLDYNVLLYHLFYQLTIRRFGEMNYIILGKPLDVREYVLNALNSPMGEWVEANGSKEKIATCVVDLLIENSEMLQEYFRIGINENGFLCTLPDLIPGYLPNPCSLPMFLLRLGTETDWDEEILCFRSIAAEIGYLFSSLPIDMDISEESSKSIHNHVDDVIDFQPSKTQVRTSNYELFSNFVLPALRTHLIAPSSCGDDGTTVIKIAALEQLYKVFERC